MASPRQWRKMPQQYRLLASACDACGRVSFPPTTTCPACRGSALREKPLALCGTLLGFTNRDGQRDGLALVETADGARLLCALTDDTADPLAVGQPVALVFRRLGYDRQTQTVQYGHKAQPLKPDDERKATP